MNAGDLDARVRAGVYEWFIEHGRAPVAAEIAGALSEAPVRVEEAFHRLHEAHMLVLAPGSDYIWMANPFSALPTSYRVEAAGKTFWGNCIWDALGIVVMMGSQGRIDSLCPDCGEAMSVEVHHGELVASDDASERLVHFTVPARHWWDDIGYN